MHAVRTELYMMVLTLSIQVHIKATHMCMNCITWWVWFHFPRGRYILAEAIPVEDVGEGGFIGFRGTSLSVESILRSKVLT